MFTKEDEALHKGLMKLLDEASFTLKAREVRAFLLVYEWTKELPNRHTIKNKKVKNGIR